MAKKQSKRTRTTIRRNTSLVAAAVERITKKQYNAVIANLAPTFGELWDSTIERLRTEVVRLKELAKAAPPSHVKTLTEDEIDALDNRLERTLLHLGNATHNLRYLQTRVGLLTGMYSDLVRR